MVDRKVKRTDIQVIEVDANAQAEKLGDQRMANMVLLGAMLSKLPVLPVSAIERRSKPICLNGIRSCSRRTSRLYVKAQPH
jgi:2-oxoglutarate ferredoxin oxidoreductase subunit gamma